MLLPLVAVFWSGGTALLEVLDWLVLVEDWLLMFDWLLVALWSLAGGTVLFGVALCGVLLGGVLGDVLGDVLLGGVLGDVLFCV